MPEQGGKIGVGPFSASIAYSHQISHCEQVRVEVVPAPEQC